jgi:Acetyltransferase (GNAT) domain
MRASVYTAVDKRRWDDFVEGSKNGTFLFFRDYMDYHSDRFDDYSLLLCDDHGGIRALLPANRKEDLLLSHAGLTYGGVISDQRMSLPLMMEVFQTIVLHLTRQKFSKFIYKTIPHIYHTLPAEEDMYILFRKNALLFRRDALTVIDYARRIKFQERRLRAIRKARRYPLPVRETEDYRQFWEILAKNLSIRHGLRPVHSVDEMELLSRRFPSEIKLYAAFDGEVMRAGAVVFLSRNVCHVQYNASSEEGKDTGALDTVMDYLIEHYSRSKRFFDLGVSTEKDGRYLNSGLVEYKEGFGARTVVHDFYKLDLLEP